MIRELRRAGFYSTVITIDFDFNTYSLSIIAEHNLVSVEDYDDIHNLQTTGCVFLRFATGNDNELENMEEEFQYIFNGNRKSC